MRGWHSWRVARVSAPLCSASALHHHRFLMQSSQPCLCAAVPCDPPDWRANISSSIRAILRRNGPLPLPQLSKQLDDDAMELLSTQAGGLAGFLSPAPRPRGAAATRGTGTAATPRFELVALPGRIKIVFASEYVLEVAPRDRELVLWLAALFVATIHFPRAELLPSAHPTTTELLRIVQQHGPVLSLRASGAVAGLAAFEDWILKHDQIFAMVGKRVALGSGDTRHGIQEAVRAAVYSTRGHWLSGRTSPLSAALKGGAAGADPKATPSQVAANRLLEALQAAVPSTFFVPLSALTESGDLTAAQLGASDLDASTSASAVAELLAAKLPAGLLDVHVFGPGLDQLFLRVLDPAPVKAGGAAPAEASFPDVRFTATHCVFSVGAKVVSQLTAAREADPALRSLLVRGVTMERLHEMLSPPASAALKGLFGPAAPLAPTGASLSAHILLFDRLRHLFDVDVKRGVVRPWAVLPSSEQPSSLTAETTPLPLVLRFTQSSLRAESLSVAELFSALPLFLRRQLLSAYSDPAWMRATRVAVAEAALAKGAKCLRGFISQHSLYFTVRSDSSGMERVCSPQLLAAAAGGGAVSWANTGSYTDAAKAEMIFGIMPPEQPVSWTHFSNTPSARELPFPAYRSSADFFKRHFSFFRTYEPFLSTAQVIGRTDGVPPPARVLQPPQNNTDTLLKMLALHAVGGTTELAVTQSLSKQGRGHMKVFGTFTALAEQLPQWFEVRKDQFNTGNALITYVGPGIPTEKDENCYFLAHLPLRTVRNDASCFLPRDAPEAKGDSYDEWDPDWNEED